MCSALLKKYSGDDPDVTDGMKVYAKAEKIESFLKRKKRKNAVLKSKIILFLPEEKESAGSQKQD